MSTNGEEAEAYKSRTPRHTEIWVVKSTQRPGWAWTVHPTIIGRADTLEQAQRAAEAVAAEIEERYPLPEG